MEKKTKTDKVIEAINQLAEAIKSLEKRIDEYVGKPKELPKEEIKLETSQESETPFPLEWRMVIDEVLSPGFKAGVNYRGDGKFELSICVPKEYSNAREPDWELNKEDKRFKVIDNALGVVGIREYASQVLENLGSDIKAKIAEDKSKLSGV